VAGAVAIAVLVPGAAALWPAVRARLHDHPYFVVRTVTVRGAARLTPDAVRGRAGVEPGTSIWDVDGERARTRLLEEPWVRLARVRRRLPDRVVIQVTEERPVAILASPASAEPGRDGEAGLYYLNARGRVIAAVGPADTRDLPYVTGLARADLEAGDGSARRAARRALGLLRLASRAGPVSEVHVDARRGFTLLPVRPTLPIEIGWGGVPRKLAALPAVLARWEGREAEIAAVSLRFRDQVVVRLRRVPGASLHAGVGGA
jgi:cell division protein FtsQ